MVIEIIKTNANDINLNKDMYAEAYDRGVTFSQYLEMIDPSEEQDKKDGLDAYERQMKRFGIRTKNDPRTGTGASRGEMFFQSNIPASRILFPEFLNRVARVAVMNEDDIMSSIVASTESITGSNMMRALYIDDTEAQRTMSRVGEMGKFPVVKISWSEKATSLSKYGVKLQMSYEFTRRASLPLITLFIGRIMLQRRLNEVTEAIAVLLAGDGTTHASGGAISNVNLSTYQGGAPTGTSDMTYASWLKFLYSFYPGRCTTILGCADDIVEALTISKPSVDPMWFISYLDSAKLGGVPRLVNGRIGSSVDYVISDDISANDLIGLDNRYALIAYREAGTDLTEWDEIVMSNTIGFQTVFAAARKKLSTDA
jgi:hypothetical protein